jgi:micrococcal nuclease
VHRRHLLIFLVVVAAALMFGSALNGGVGGVGRAGRAPDPRVAHVVEVVDGDTITARFVSGTVRTVRYVGIDAPATRATGDEPECFGARAAAANARLVPPGSRVRLEFDAVRQSPSGALLAYVYRENDGVLAAAELLRRGYARVLTIPPNLRHVDAFVALGRAARERRRGVWRACPMRNS